LCKEGLGAGILTVLGLAYISQLLLADFSVSGI
jgi:hypothetical protein